MSLNTCLSVRRVTAHLLLSFLAFAPLPSIAYEPQQQLLLPKPGIPDPSSADSHKEHDFVSSYMCLLLEKRRLTYQSLRHIFHHGTYAHPNLHKQFDVTPSKETLWIEDEDGLPRPVQTSLRALSHSLRIERLKDRRPSVIEPLVAAARNDEAVWAWMSPSAWTMDQIPGPNITDKDTIITLAQMAANAYVPEPETGEWKDVNGGFNRTDDYGFGWDADGLRGYIYADKTNSTIVIGLKGTSLAVYDGEGTTTKDKENDNLYFSCCCGQQGSALYRKVCDCATGTYTCNTSCLKKKMREENRYYMAARHLYSNVTELYPNANVWMSGHSLGGSLGAMLGLTYGIPVVTFEAVPDALPAGRLGLPHPPGANPARPQAREYTGAYHFGNTADPVFLGICNGATASCSYAGYALESACHTGMECVYDVVGDLGWGVHIWSHRITTVIESIIKKYDTVPVCRYTPECQDCPLWKEVKGNSTLTSSTSTTTTKTRTRTTTCKTPGWWGCLDDSTTSGPTTTTASTSTTSSCKTPGWFGCKDKTSERPAPTHTSVTTTTSETCHSRGYFGCLDPTGTQTKTISTPTTSCQTPGHFWGCQDSSSSTLDDGVLTITAAPFMLVNDG